MFYTNFFLRGSKVYLRGIDKHGQRVQEIVKYKPYLFVPDKEGEYKTIKGQPVGRIDFDSVRDARDFVERYKDVHNFTVYGSTNFGYNYINDNYPGQLDHDRSKINVITLDIEVESDDGFPDPVKADKMITAITLRKKNRNAVFSYGDFVTDDPNTFYIKCKDEADLIEKFLQTWSSPQWSPDIVTGWYIEHFDIPYLFNRINRLMGAEHVKRLSPWKMVEARELNFGGVVYNLYGIAILDYMALHKKFSFTNHESYKLDYIAFVELGEKKISYEEYGSLHNLYKQNFQKFIEYNIHDCVLVSRLDQKLGLIDQVLALAYDAKINYTDTLTTVRSWDTIIHNELMADKIVVPPVKENYMTETLAGGHVKDPQIGMHEWVVSYDLDSLYPHLEIQYNISPDTIGQQLPNFPSVDKLLENMKNGIPLDIPEGYTVAANGVLFSKEYQGFLPRLMERMYADRAKYKALSIEDKKRYEVSKLDVDLNLYSKHNNLQKAKKIQLNAAYGALANVYYRWFAFLLAEAITVSGQLSIRWIEYKINVFLNDMFNTVDVDYVIASDTDSLYVNMKTFVDMNAKRFAGMSKIEIKREIDKFSNEHITPFMAEAYQELADYMSCYKQKMRMKRETIASNGIWKAKKMYILNALDVEGVEYEKPLLKVQGIEAVRSSTPYVCRETIKDALKIVLDNDKSKLLDFVDTFREKFDTLRFDEIASPRGMNNLKKYSDKTTLYKKGTPIHVKGALIFNKLIQDHGMSNVKPIQDGDKIKYAYLKLPNPLRETVISVPEFLPAEFDLDKYIDRDLQFERTFLDPIKNIVSTIGWSMDNKASLESFFS